MHQLLPEQDPRQLGTMRMYMFCLFLVPSCAMYSNSQCQCAEDMSYGGTGIGNPQLSAQRPRATRIDFPDGDWHSTVATTVKHITPLVLPSDG